LEHTGVDADAIGDQVAAAKASGDWDELLTLRDRVEERINAAWSISDLLRLSPTQFEQILAILYSELGYNAQVTKQSGDRGVDVVATSAHETVAIQAKRYHPEKSGNVSGPEVREAIGATIQLNANICVVASTSGFSSEAKHAARDTTQIRVQLLTGQDIIEKLAEAGVPTPY